MMTIRRRSPFCIRFYRNFSPAVNPCGCRMYRTRLQAEDRDIRSSFTHLILESISTPLQILEYNWDFVWHNWNRLWPLRGNNAEPILAEVNTSAFLQRFHRRYSGSQASEKVIHQVSTTAISRMQATKFLILWTMYPCYVNV